MKALFARAPDDFGLIEKPKPRPAADEALVKVSRAALCHTDVIIREGVAGHVRYPFVPGHEFAGVVDECGPAVKHLRSGDRVAVHQVYTCGQCSACRKGDTNACRNGATLGSRADGGFAEYCAVPARMLFKLPDHVTLAEEALVEPLANAVSAVRHSNVKTGERVVIIGPGPIGLLALQVARLANPSVLVLVGTRDKRLALGERLGATQLVNIKREGALERLKEILSQKGADVIIDCAGTRSALELAMDIVGWRGRIAIEGVNDTQEMVPISPYFLVAQSISLTGINGWVTADFARALELISSGLVDVKTLITHVFALDEWETAFDMITNRKSKAIKVQFAFDTAQPQ